MSETRSLHLFPTLLHINNSNYAAVQLGDNTTAGFTITKESTDNSFNIWTGAVGSGTNRLRVTTTGYVGINTEPKVQLHVKAASVALVGDNTNSGGNAIAANKIDSYPPDTEVNHFSTVLQSTGGDSGGLLIIANDNNGDEKAIDIWNEMTGVAGSSSDTKGRKFSVRTSTGNTFIAGSLEVSGGLDLNGSKLQDYIVDIDTVTFSPGNTDYTLPAGITGSVIHIASGSTANGTIRAPKNLAQGYNVMIVNGSTRNVSIQGTAVNGATIVNVNGKISIGKQYGICNLLYLDSDTVLVTGDLS